MEDTAEHQTKELYIINQLHHRNKGFKFEVDEIIELMKKQEVYTYLGLKQVILLQHKGYQKMYAPHS